RRVAAAGDRRPGPATHGRAALAGHGPARRQSGAIAIGRPQQRLSAGASDRRGATTAGRAALDRPVARRGLPGPAVAAAFADPERPDTEPGRRPGAGDEPAGYRSSSW